jgi:peptide deformylase
MSQTEPREQQQPRERRPRSEIPPERRAAALAQVRTLGDPVLRESARPVETFDSELAALSRRMIAVMRDAPGIGLAATQLGVVKRMIVYQVDDDPVTLVNPRIVGASDDTEVLDEGCLSLPGVTVPVERPTLVRVRARDLRGRPLEYDAEDLEARVIQHEIDHLDGVLILERTSREERGRVLRELRERQTAAVPSGSGL